MTALIQNAGFSEPGTSVERYARLPDLLGKLVIHPRRVWTELLQQTQLLILDEWLLYRLKKTEARDLLELAGARYKKASTIFCSQHDIGGWHGKIGESTLAFQGK